MGEVVRLQHQGEAETTYEDDDIIKKLKDDFRAADDMSSQWRQEAIELYDLYSGRQWSEADKLLREEQLKPALEFNLMAKYIDAVQGLQIANRMDMRFVPRELGDVKVNEILTSAADWARDGCSAWAHESEAWKDMLISGLGATETFIDFDDDPEGLIKVERREGVELWLDPTARKQNYLDARWMQRVRYMTQDEIESRWEDKADEVGGSMGIEPIDTYGFEGYIHNANDAWRYENDARGGMGKKMTPVVEYQWFERNKMVRVFTPMGKKDLTPAQANQLCQVLEMRGIPYKKSSFRGKKYFRAFCAGNIVLEKGESPYQNGFTYGFMTGKRDRNSNTWMGIGRSLKDPQHFVNKIFSEAVYILSTQAKGGLLAEEDAFVDPKRAEDEWAKPDSIVWTEPGAVREGKITPKPQTPIPNGFHDFLNFAMQALPETSGLNLEILGMTNKVQPGIVEAQRKQSAMTMIQWAFDSLKLYYDTHGRQLASYVRDYISDGRLIRIKSGDTQKYIPLIREQMTYDFDVIVDESPTSANQKEKTFAVMMELLPIMAQSGQGIPPEFWEHSPLPSELAEKLAKSMRPDPQQVQAQQQKQQQIEALAFAEQRAKVEKLQSESKENEADVILKQQQARKAAAEAGQKMAGV